MPSLEEVGQFIERWQALNVGSLEDDGGLLLETSLDGLLDLRASDVVDGLLRILGRWCPCWSRPSASSSV